MIIHFLLMRISAIIALLRVLRLPISRLVYDIKNAFNSPKFNINPQN